MSDPAREARQAKRSVDRRRLEEIFGETLPSQTRDDLDGAGAKDVEPSGRTEQWYREQTPPHHGEK